MLLRRRDIDNIICAKCNKDSEIVIREGEIRGSLKILVHPCSCHNDKPKPIPVMFIDDIEKQYVKFLGTSAYGQNIYTEWKSYE